MLTFSALRRFTRGLTAGQVDDAVIEMVARLELKRLWEGWDWSFSQREGVLATKALKSDGTVTLTAPTIVTGTGTSFTTDAVDCDLIVGNQNARYKVQAVNVGTQTLTLTSAYVGNSFTASAYRLQQSLYALAEDFNSSFAPTWWRLLVEISMPTLDRYDSRRAYSSNAPYSFTYGGMSATGAHLATVTPVPATAIALHYTYRSRLPVLDDETLIPFREDVPSYLIAATALSIKAIELAEKNPGAAGILQAQAEKYFLVGRDAYIDFQDQDGRVVGRAKAVRDEAEMGSVPDDYLISTDYFSPIR